MEKEQFETIRPGTVVADQGENLFLVVERTPGHLGLIRAINAEMAQHFTPVEEPPARTGVTLGPVSMDGPVNVDAASGKAAEANTGETNTGEKDPADPPPPPPAVDQH